MMGIVHIFADNYIMLNLCQQFLQIYTTVVLLDEGESIYWEHRNIIWTTNQAAHNPI